MKFLKDAVARVKKKGKQTPEVIHRSANEIVAEEIVAEYGAQGKRISGYGHLIHNRDPRTTRLFCLADDLGLPGSHREMAKAVERALEENTGRKLPTNINGAVAAVLLDMGFEPELANVFFIIARLPGLVAHIREEVERQKPLRPINPLDVEYDGPPERELPESRE